MASKGFEGRVFLLSNSSLQIIILRIKLKSFLRTSESIERPTFGDICIGISCNSRLQTDCIITGLQGLIMIAQSIKRPSLVPTSSSADDGSVETQENRLFTGLKSFLMFS